MKCVVLFQSVILKVAKVSTAQTLTLLLVLAHSLNPLADIFQ